MHIESSLHTQSSQNLIDLLLAILVILQYLQVSQQATSFNIQAICNARNIFMLTNLACISREGGMGLGLHYSTSDGVLRLGLGFETCLETCFLGSRSQVSSRSRRISVSSSQSRDFAQVIFYELLQGAHYKTVSKNDCSKFSRSKRSVAKLSLLLCYLRDGENNFPLPRLKCILNSIKMCMYQTNRSAKSLHRDVGRTLLRTIFELFHQQFSFETHRLIQKRWESAKKVSFLRSQ